MQEIFERIFNLIKKTGDKVIIVNPGSESSFVMMTLRDYEKMVTGEMNANQVDLTVSKSQDTIDNVNREIAAWREQEGQKDDVLPFVDAKSKKDETSETDSQFYFEPVE